MARPDHDGGAGDEEDAHLTSSHPASILASLNSAGPATHQQSPPQQQQHAPTPTMDDQATAKKRRRVVVACQTCRRKKVKCRGLPNPSNTCDNCAAYGYRCTFDMDQDRSRGKYEILESKADTLLAALRSVAPQLAELYDRGELKMNAPSGYVSSEGANSQQHHQNHMYYGHYAYPQQYPPPGAAPAGPRLGPSSFEVATMLPPMDASSAAGPSTDTLPPLRSLGKHFATRIPPPPPTHIRGHGPMVPDLEDGRPRFFGRSSTLSHFHALDSRPPSVSPPPPSDDGKDEQRRRSAYTPTSRPTSREGVSTAPHNNNNGKQRSVTFAPVPTQDTRRPSANSQLDERHKRHSSRSRSPSPQRKRPASRPTDPANIKEWTVLPRPKPLYPSNSREWVHLLRRKNTVAVGRDDICTDEWATRYMLPEHDLVFHLLDDIYFPHLHPLLPILHPPTFRRDIANGRATHDTAFRGLVFCVLTISSRFSTDTRVFADPSDPHSAGDHWAAASRLYHQTFAASLINVQVLLLTSTYMHASIGPGSSWTILGVAIRALMDIGLHQERANADFTPFDQEMRRRVFWAAFILDCIFAVCLGRPNAIRLEDCSVNLPLDVSDEVLGESEASGQPVRVSEGEREDGKGESSNKSPSPPTVASGFRHMVKLNLVVHDVVQTLYTQRKAGSLPEWQAHPGLGPVKGKGKDKNGDQEGGVEEEEDNATDKPSPPSSPGLHNPEYKAMALLCRRLDEWVAETPAHLRDPSTSPFKLQAGIVSCGTHDIRLYILKPFLPDPFLYKMLHPQCVYHARACLQTVIDLYESNHLNNMVFIFTQAFMSSVTFLLTVWQVTRHAKDLAPDATLIEKTARMMILAFDDRFCSALFRKAWRMLQRIATRVMPFMKDDEQRKRTRYWINAKGSAGGIPLPLQSYSAGSAPASASTTMTHAPSSSSASSASPSMAMSPPRSIPVSHEPRGSNGVGAQYKNTFTNDASPPSGGPTQAHGLPTQQAPSNGHSFPPRHFASPLFPWQVGGPNGGIPTTDTPPNRSRPNSRPSSRHRSRPTSPGSFALDHWARGSDSHSAGWNGGVENTSTAQHPWAPSQQQPLVLDGPSFGDADGILGYSSGGYTTRVEQGNMDRATLFDGPMVDLSTTGHDTSSNFFPPTTDPRMSTLYMDGGRSGDALMGMGGMGGGGGGGNGAAGDSWQDYFWKFLAEVDTNTNPSSTDSFGAGNPGAPPSSSSASVPAESPYQQQS